nr:NLR family, CARD domain containing 5 isoform X1 [Nothobranchius furzeri]
MDEEELDDENVKCVLVQESSKLFQILCSQSPSVIMSLCQMLPHEAGRHDEQASTGSAAASVDHVNALLQYFRGASAAECRNFLQSVCVMCENMPMHLESRLLSVAGYASSENSTPSVTNQEPSSLQLEEQLTKRPRIDYWELYIKAATDFHQRRWKNVSEGLVKDVQLEKVWVGLRAANRGRERPDRTPGSADRGGRTPELGLDYGCLESRLTLESFLQGCAGKVTLLCGPAGSGRTLLMSCLGQQWADGLGPIPSSTLFVLLEFRQLNLLSSPVSLSDLLFQHCLPPPLNDDVKQAVVDYLLSNPGQSCWVLDGYDEFHWKFHRQTEPLDVEEPLPVTDLLSGLLNRQLLPGSTVLVTCRVRDVSDFDGLPDKVGELLPWDQQEIREYVDGYFGIRDGSLQTEAADLLLSNHHLLTMSSIPAFCNICCMVLEFLLLASKNTDRAQTPEGGKRGGSSTKREEEGSAGESEISPGLPEVPTTRTQVYLAVVAAFLSRHPHTRGRNDQTRTSRFPESCLRELSRYSSKLCELSRLAWESLEKSKILFMKEDIPGNILAFSVRTGLLRQVELRRGDGKLVSAYSFVHQTVQEFLAALRIMTSEDLTIKQLKKRFSLKTRWITKSDQKSVFTDSLYLFVCGLASSRCTEALVLFARESRSKGVQSWVQKRQTCIVDLLKTQCPGTLTGPKILQLCHCVQESQDQDLARQVVSARPTLELRNFCLWPNDIHALAFVVNSAADSGAGLDFGSCSMDLECLDVLSWCRNIHDLSFRRRKYGDKFAEKLSTVLPEFRTLRKLEFCGASLTAAGAASLASGLQECATITEINFSDNNLQDEGIRHVAEIFPKLQNLLSVTLGRNNASLKAAQCLVEKMTFCLNVQQVHADGNKELTVTFLQSSDVNSRKTNPERAVSLLNQKWNKPDMQKFAKSLTKCPPLSVLNLSGGQWDEETLKTLTQFVPKLTITEKITLNGSCTSVEGLVVLTALLSECPSVSDLQIRLQNPVEASVRFAEGKPGSEMSKTLSLSCCNLLPKDLERVLKSLGTSPDLAVLDLSSNRLGDKGLKKLLDVLSHFKKVQRVNVSENGVSMDGAVLLAAALCSSYTLCNVHISDGGKGQVLLQLRPNSSDNKHPTKAFRMKSSSVLPPDVTKICKRLTRCRSGLELEFSKCTFGEKAIGNLLKVLPDMSTLQRLDVSSSVTMVTEALSLIRCLTDNQRVTCVEFSPQTESFIMFDGVKAEEVKCRLTGFCFRDVASLKRLLEILQQDQLISYLDLSDNQLEDEGVKFLIDSLPKLQISSCINLSYNRLSRQGLMGVATTLSTCPDVSDVETSLGEEKRCLIWFRRQDESGKSLRISNGSLERDHLISLAEIVSRCPSLTRLVLKNNTLQWEWIETFIRVLTCSQRGLTVSVEESWIGSEEAVSLAHRCLQLNKNISTLRIHQTGLQLSLMNSELTSVSLGDRIQLPLVEGFTHQFPQLTELDFSTDRLGVEFLSSLLPSLPNLTSLSVGIKERTPAVVEELSQILLQMTLIQRLNLSGHSISDAAAQSLTELFPRLRSIGLSCCVWSEDGGLQLIRALRRSKHLEELCLDAALQLKENSWECLAEALGNMTSIQSLKLDGWRMDDGGIQQLIKTIPGWKRLKKISLSKNVISDASGEKLLDALKSCSLLEELHLSSNFLGDLTAASMSLVLPSMTRLAVLDVSVNRFGKDGSVSLAKAVRSLTNLRKIHLTSVGTSELGVVAASLGKCPFIQDVGLGWNHCGDDVVLELAKILPLCRDLIRLDLECNSVSSAGLAVLVKALQSCPSLQIIRLWKNNVSVSEAQRFSQTERRLSFSSM